jgi:three-Cys-motif partner protein
MKPKEELHPYLNREHALVKHMLFERYFKRFIMILGSRPNLAYIDAFAGPWLSSDDDYLDTSFGRAINAIESCSVTLAQQHNKRPRFRSLLIEADQSAFSELNSFAQKSSKATATVEARNWKFEESISQISEWIRPGEKTFVLIDPKAYRGLISPSVLSPLLKNPNVELLINYMWQFINLAIGHSRINEKHDKNLKDLHGAGYSEFSSLPSGEKESSFIREYKKRLAEESGLDGENRLRTASFPIQYADKDGTKYYLVYATHNPRGLIAFSEASDEAIEDQKEVQFFVGQKKREERTGVADMFHEIHEPHADLTPREDAWLEALPSHNSVVIVDHEFWANMLERYNCLPSQLQTGLKNLMSRGLIEVVGATSRRKKNFVHWKKSETVRRLK